jgi:hypothetical protein
MKLLRSILIATALAGMSSAMAGPLVPGPIAAPASPVIQVAQGCTCIGGFIGGGGNPVCNEYECHDLPQSVTLPKITRSRDCPKSRMLVCESNSCKVTCDPSKK